MKLSSGFLIAFGAIQQAYALTSAQWRSQSIYQIVTDRFARTDGSTTASCNVNNYCGGSWQGIINKLDYIQGMGFTAVGHIMSMRVPFQLTVSRSGFPLLWRIFLNLQATANPTTATGRRISTD